VAVKKIASEKPDAEAIAQAKELLKIPSEEPIFILRGQDRLARRIIQRYVIELQAITDPAARPSGDFISDCQRVLEDFDRFAMNYPFKMHHPD
jgi:hypothetical protein